jgi:hypothetical protein
MVVDLLGLLDQLHDEVVVDGLRAGIVCQVDRKHVGIEQKARLERIED